MKPRITISLRADGELELWINSEGRDLLVQELLGLGEKRDHIHLTPKDWGPAEVELSQRSYRTTDKVISSAKILFRTDEWDRAHFPHVLGTDEQA